MLNCRGGAAEALLQRWWCRVAGADNKVVKNCCWFRDGAKVVKRCMCRGTGAQVCKQCRGAEEQVWWGYSRCRCRYRYRCR